MNTHALLPARIVNLALAICLGSFLLAGCEAGPRPGAGPATGKVGVIQLEKLYAEADAAQDGIKMLNDIQTRYEPRLKELQDKSAGSDKGDDAATKEFSELLGKYQAEMSSEQARITQLINQALQKALQEVQSQGGYAVILPSNQALAFSEQADVTAEVVKRLNANKLDLKAGGQPAGPTPAPELAPAPQAGPAPTPAPEPAPAPSPAPPAAEQPAKP